MARLLLVEDDARIRAAVLRALADRGHAVEFVDRGLAAVDRILHDAPDLVILDLGLPDVDGVDLLRMIRGISDVPIVVATARDDDEDVVATLDAGADDYVIKPYSSAQLEARIRAVLRRRAADETTGQQLSVGGLTIDLAARDAHLDGVRLDLARMEFDLLAHLARNVGQVVNRHDLIAEVWRQPLGGADRTLDVHVSWLRKKLGESAAEPRYLVTVRGVGIKLVDPGAS